MIAPWERAQESVTDLVELLPVVRALMVPGVGGPKERSYSGKAAASPPPWNTAAAEWVLDVDLGARQHQGVLEMAVFGVRRLTRAGTVTVLVRIVDLVRLADERGEQELVREVVSDLGAWRRRGKVMVGDWRPDARVPLDCPYCQERGTLFQRPSDHDPRGGAVYCRNPLCLDDDGRAYSWEPDDLRWLGEMVSFACLSRITDV